MGLPMPTHLLLLLFASAVLAQTDCCKFTLSASPSFPQPAGELQDGQIRFNGSYPQSTFCLKKDGGFVDGNGFGCIVTGPPETQIQCDQGKSPDKDFSVSSNNTLLYKGSPSFFACPATDTEYNIYVAPNFNQSKCFPITLTTSGCGATNTTCPPPTTIWMKEWVTETVPQSVTFTFTTVTSCGGNSTVMPTSGGWNGTASAPTKGPGESNTMTGSMTIATTGGSTGRAKP